MSPTLAVDPLAGSLALTGVGFVGAAIRQIILHGSRAGDVRRLRRDTARATRAEQEETRRCRQEARRVLVDFQRDARGAAAALARGEDPADVLDDLSWRREVALDALGELTPCDALMVHPGAGAYARHPIKGARDMRRTVGELKAWMDEQAAAVHHTHQTAIRDLLATERLWLQGPPLPPSIEAMVAEVAQEAMAVASAAPDE